MTKRLWIGDNGHITCRDCAGATAQATKMRRDLYGPMHAITLADLREVPGFDPECETCGAKVSVIETVRS